MISEPLFTAEPSSVLAHPWALGVFRVEDEMAQQRVLRALRRLGRSDLTAVAARRGDETFVIIDWDVIADKSRAQQVVMLADRNAAMTFRSREKGASVP